MTKIYKVTLYYAKLMGLSFINKNASMGFYSNLEIAFEVQGAIERNSRNWDEKKLIFRFTKVTTHFLDARSGDLKDNFFDLSKWEVS